MSLLFGLLASSLVGTAVFIALLAMRPLTLRFFSKTWHYYSLFVPLVFMLGGAVIASGMVSRFIDSGLLSRSAQESPAAIEQGEFAMPQLPPVIPRIETDNWQTTAGFTAPQGTAQSVHGQDGPPLAWFLVWLQNSYRYILIAWGLGAALFILVGRARYLRYRRRMLSGSKLYTEVYCPIPVALSKQAKTPMLIGLLRPVVVLPDNSYTKDELAVILTHEMVHYKRKDLAYKMLAFFAQALHWFNPIGFVITKQLGAFCELSCDESIAKEMDNMGRKFYGETILQVLLMAGPDGSSALMPATNLSCTKNEIKRRLLNMKNAKKMKKTAVALAMLLTVLVVGGGLLASYYMGEAMPNEMPGIALQASVEEPASQSIYQEAAFIQNPEENEPPMQQTPEQETSGTDFHLLLQNLRSSFNTAIANLRARHPHDINVTLLLMDIDHNALVIGYGDVFGNLMPAYHAFWPVSIALFAEVYDISIHNEFPNTLHHLPGGYAWLSNHAMQLSFEGIDYYSGYSTLLQGFRHGDPNVFFGAAEELGSEPLFELFGKLGLGVIETDNPAALLGSFELTPSELALLYGMIANGGIMYPFLGPDVKAMGYGWQAIGQAAAKQALEAMDGHLDSLDENLGLFSQIRDREHFGEFASRTIGQANEIFASEGDGRQELYGAWFVALYPAHAPRFLTVASMSFDMAHFQLRADEGDFPFGIADLAAVVYEVFLATRLVAGR